MPFLLLLKRIALIALVTVGGLVEFFCPVNHNPITGDDLNSIYPSLVTIAEGASSVGNSLKLGIAAPVPGSLPGTGKETVAAPAAGAGARSAVLISNNGNEQVALLMPDGSVASTISVPPNFANMSASRDGSIIAGTFGSNFIAYNTASGSSLYSVDLATAPNTTTTPVPAGTAILPYNEGAYITDKNSGRVFEVSFTGSPLSMVINPASSAGAGRPEISPNGQQLWIPDTAANMIAVFDTLTNTLVTTISVNAPSEVAFAPSGTRAVVMSKSATGSNTVFLIDTSTYGITGSASVGLGSTGLAVDPYNPFIWTANSGAGTISEINISGPKPVVVDTERVGSNPLGISVISSFMK
jgi:DNA-binding beta-propeller fold protein YncE